MVFMVLITTLVLCARSQDSLLSVSVRREGSDKRKFITRTLNSLPVNVFGASRCPYFASIGCPVDNHKVTLYAKNAFHANKTDVS